jgi:hypothetical protein
MSVVLVTTRLIGTVCGLFDAPPDVIVIVPLKVPTASGGSWLTVSPATGSTPTTMKVSANPTGELQCSSAACDRQVLCARRTSAGCIREGQLLTTGPNCSTKQISFSSVSAFAN